MSRKFDRSVLVGVGLLLAVLLASTAVAYRSPTAATGLVALAAFVWLFNRSLSAREAAAAALNNQREWLRTTLTSIGDAVIATDATGKVSFLNPVAATLTGWTQEEAQGRPLEEVFCILHEQTRKPVASPVQRVLAEGRVCVLADHVILVARDGTEWPIHDSAAPIRDQAGRLTGVVLVFRDWSEQRRAEALLAGQKRVLELMVHGAPLTDVLETLCATVEAQAGEPLVATILLADENVTSLRAAARGRCPKEYAALLNPIPTGPRHGSCGTAAYRGERVIVADIASDPLWADWPLFRDLALCYRLRACWSTPIFSSAGKVLGTFAVYHRAPRTPTEHDLRLVDVMAHTAGIAVERQRADAALRESEERFRVMADNLPQLAWMARPDGDLFWFNRRWYEYTGEAPEQAHGTGWQAALDPADRPRVLEKMGQAFATGEPWEDTFPLRRHDGAYRWHLSRMLPIRDSVGSITRWFGTNTDITERLEMEKFLREADRQKDEFLATLAHELRNPLAPIRTGLQVMRLSGSNGDMVEQARAMMERQLKQVVRLVDDLLDLSRITRGKIDLRREHMDLRSAARDAVETSRPLIEACRHELTVTLAAEPVYVEGDAARLAQVVSNLLNNAAKYTPEGGRIALTVGVEGGAAVVRVKDNGIGLSAEMLPRIFEMFRQVDEARERAQGGLGIGLTLVKRLVELHGGTVEARSEGPGTGCELIVSLALACPEQGPTASGAPRCPELGYGTARRILVVDDNVDAAESLALLLRLTGNEVRTAHDGPSGVEQAALFCPEVVLLDIGLPGMDGYETGRRIRQLPRMGHVALVAQTGWGQEHDRQRSQEAGFAAHMVKPLDLGALQDVLAQTHRRGS